MMEQLTDAMITVVKAVNKIVKDNTPYKMVESLLLKELIGKLDDSDVDDAIFELLNLGILKSDVDPIVFGNGLMYRPVTGISDYGNEILAEMQIS